MSDPEAVDRMCKKISQLTRVIYLLNTKNDESNALIKSLYKTYDKEMETLRKNANETIKNLQKKIEKGKDTFVLKGFYLGMPISEAQELVSCYLPKSQVVITKHNDIEIDVKHGGNFDVTPMYFCRADKDGKVYLFNFDKRFLRKWFKYDVQDYHEWAIMFGREFKIPFRQKSVKGKYAASDIVINVAQDCYQYKNNMKDYMVSFFGEKDVFDPYGNPTLSEALSNDHRAFRAGVILRGKEWVKNDWENEDGAREGTLRVRLLKDGE